MEKNRFKKLDAILLGFVLIIALTLRMYKLTAPLSDFHSWRQADTAAVARNFARDGIDLLQPRYDDLSSIQSGIENPKGLRYVEFPLYNAMFAVLYKLSPLLPIEVYGRLLTVFFSLIIASIIYYLLLIENNRLSAFFGSFLYAVLPASVFFSRVVLPETPAIAMAFCAIFTLYLWTHSTQWKRHVLFALSILFFACSILIKPTVVFYGLPILYLFLSHFKHDAFRKPGFYLYFILSAIPFVLWRVYIQKFPEGIPSSDWLIGMVNTYEGQKQIFMRPAFFRWIFYERINNMIFGGLLTGFFLIGAFRRLKSFFLHMILLAAGIYLFVFQGGNVQHEYYQTLIIPPLSMFAGIGISFIFQERKRFLSPLITAPLILFVLVLSLSFSYYYKVKDFYTYPQDLNHMAKILTTFTKPTDKIITDRLGDTTLLYMADRKGAPMLYKTLEQLREDGYTYYMTDKKEIILEIKTNQTYPVLFENNQFALFKL